MISMIFLFLVVILSNVYLEGFVNMFEQGEVPWSMVHGSPV
jgi:hypothetical protein